MSLRPYKFQIVAVVQQVDGDGNVVAEQATQPAEVFGCDALARWAAAFPAKLADIEQTAG